MKRHQGVCWPNVICDGRLVYSCQGPVLGTGVQFTPDVSISRSTIVEFIVYEMVGAQIGASLQRSFWYVSDVFNC